MVVFWGLEERIAGCGDGDEWSGVLRDDKREGSGSVVVVVVLFWLCC